MQPADRILQAAAEVDAIDVAGRVIANPARNAQRVGAGEVLALAYAVEHLTAAVIEAELLLRALQMPITGADAGDAARDHAIQTQMDTLNSKFAVLFGTKGT